MVSAAVAAVLLLLFLVAPPLLFGRALSAFDLLLISVGVLAIGLLVRMTGGAEIRRLGGILLVIGALLVAVSGALTALLLAGWGRGY